jgi:hypothetical protein
MKRRKSMIIHKNKSEQITGYGFPSECDKVEEISTMDLFKLLCWMILILLLVALGSYLDGVQD